METHYKSSKGLKLIADLPLPYARNAVAKLRREEPGRTAEIEAIDAHIAKVEAEIAAEGENPRAVIGGNNPPEETPPAAGAPEQEVEKISGRTAIDTHIADLLTEAANWTDGAAIANQEQADSVSRLRRLFQQAEGLVNDTAAGEKKPHNDAIAEIGAWQNGYIAKGLKKTPDGVVTKALALLGRLDTGWLLKLEAERKERERQVTAEAAAAAAEALAAREEAKTTTDAAVVEQAEDRLAVARSLLKQAEGVAKERVQSGGGDGMRSSSLRTYWIATPSGEETAWRDALNHYMRNEQFKADVRDLIQRYASRDAGVEATRAVGIPGFRITEDRRAA